LSQGRECKGDRIMIVLVTKPTRCTNFSNLFFE